MRRLKCPECFGTGHKTINYGNRIVSTEKEHCPNCEDGYVDNPDWLELEQRVANLEAEMDRLRGDNR